LATEDAMFGANHHDRPTRFRRGQSVVVRSLSEILATLDSEAKLEGIPFMPEMAQYCGRARRVFRRVENVYIDYHYYVARLSGTVLLEDMRCDGQAHHGCQMGCTVFWKEAWLQPAGVTVHGDCPDFRGEACENGTDARRGSPDPAGTADRQVSPETGRPLVEAVARSGDRPQRGAPALSLPTEKDGRFYCQATELMAAATRLPWWDVRQYARALLLGEMSPGKLLGMIGLMGYNKLAVAVGRKPYQMLRGTHQQAAHESLNLQPGEWVEVKSRAEVEATLDASGKHRGLAFVPDMTRHCGRRYRVARRVDRMIVEWTGQMRDLKDTVALEGVTCRGMVQRACPRNCFHLWREAWLKRVE
jgi:hypothetical protein